jgi:uncharacterized Zn-binding protein involved in type VI secretion
MGEKVARKSGTDTVSIPHPTCQGSTETDAGSSNVLINGIGAVREGDAVASHTLDPPACPSHAPGLSTFSSKVLVNGKGLGRLGDTYGCGAKISSGSDNVFAG